MHSREEIIECLGCGGHLPLGTLEVVCSTMCEHLVERQTKSRDSQWDYDPEEALYS